MSTIPQPSKPGDADEPGAKDPAEEVVVDDPLEGNPDTPLAPVETLLEAMRWAFEGEEIPPAVLERYAQHARMVLETNREVNLTAIVDPREMAAKHYLDSWRVTRQVSLFGRSVLDLGSGAGFPGLPVAMADADTRVTLIDSVQKRTDFLTRCVETLGVKNASVVRDRAEDHLARQSYDVVMIRAVSSVRENVRLLRKVRHSHKDLVMLKGPSWGREVRAGEREAERLGFRLDTVWEHKLPGEMGARAILVYRAPGGHGS
ncbi:MAG: 16S rRNA (guanine(527)-N(7))-methyltransferase RsmG [Planctomycetota bacterium]